MPIKKSVKTQEVNDAEKPFVQIKIIEKYLRQQNQRKKCRPKLSHPNYIYQRKIRTLSNNNLMKIILNDILHEEKIDTKKKHLTHTTTRKAKAKTRKKTTFLPDRPWHKPVLALKSLFASLPQDEVNVLSKFFLIAFLSNQSLHYLCSN